MNRKKIGVSYSEANFENYWNWFSNGDLAEKFELVLLSFEKNNTTAIFQCDGFVLTGGIDVLPEIYGGSCNYPYRPEHFLPERDEFERIIYNHAQAKRLPVLGICRGMQYINILEGGKVFEDNGETVHETHKKALKDKIHGLIVQQGSLLYDITMIHVGKVNSAHHQAIDPAHLGGNLMVSAWADTEDRLIEAIEFSDKTDKGFLIGVQWHPERMLDREYNPLSAGVKAAFLEAVALI